MQVIPELAIADPMAPLPARVLGVQQETHDTFTLELMPPAGPFEFQPGQFNMLYVYGVGESAISISGDPDHPERLVHTVRAVGPVTRGLCSLAEGDTVGLRGPFGTGWPVREATGGDIVIVAGGIGLAPLRPAILDVMAHRDDYGRVVILYGTRTPQDLLFEPMVREWRSRFGLEVGVTVDAADERWHGPVGVVTKLIDQATFDPETTSALVCGPEIMMRFTARELVDEGVDADRVFLSMERNMKCAIGFCGHCQFGPMFVCKDGPVMPYSQVAALLDIREV